MIVIPQEQGKTKNDQGINKKVNPISFSMDIRPQTLRSLPLPRIPLGLRKRTTSRIRNARASLYSDEMSPAPSDSKTPTTASYHGSGHGAISPRIAAEKPFKASMAPTS